MIDYQEVLEIHQVLIQEFGGTQGVRDANGLRGYRFSEITVSCRVHKCRA